MSEKMVANLIPTAAKILDLGVFNKVAVRDVDIKEEFGDTHSGDAVEVLTFTELLDALVKRIEGQSHMPCISF